MNIFVTSQLPIDCAKALDDLRLNKMIVESAQILSTVLHIHEAPQALEVYKATHSKHPCVLWAAENESNYSWLYVHLFDLLAEREYRFRRPHKTANKLYTLSAGRRALPEGPMTPFVNCTPHKDIPVYEAYRRTLREKWDADKRPPHWTNRGYPNWRFSDD